MPKLADEIKKLGMRPGLWTRPLLAKPDESKKIFAAGFQNVIMKDAGATLIQLLKKILSA